MSTTHKSHDLIKFKFSKKKSEQSSWALSYGDIVTVLLCFFIIFYALEKQLEKTSSAGGKPAQTGSSIQEHKSPKFDTKFNYAIEVLEKVDGIEIQRSSDFMDIIFKKTIFFEKGKSKITNEGIVELEKVMSKLADLKGHYLIEIQGHADSTPVKSQKTRWWKSNMELSVLRALEVHTFLAQKIEKEKLIVAGYGNQKDIESNNPENDDFNRKISLRLQLVK